MNTVKFRRARHSDIPALLELLRQVNLVHYEGRPDLFNKVTKYSESELFERIDNVDNPVFVAVSSEDDTKIYGHCFCISQDHRVPADRLFTDIKTLYIEDLCVDENARGLGVGRKLLEFVRNWAREREYYNLTLGVWECNPNARAFYEAMGMKPQETVMETIL
ncbi:GNAT family N-acetyltransferase [Alloscardovia theropitheci]|uniref:GNAT family N-acetyltransferase n=1 Tax=Alloscardovia theropitheci TaxID=2496842 RepID=A0A4R0QZS3_9BIFI|nr:GNAT family N-acetyltransferase [Alloscardovia theropitheci]TCD54186.1 GNAT family N-acetyltransferase [Alloscardovia theropitheci]